MHNGNEIARIAAAEASYGEPHLTRVLLAAERRCRTEDITIELEQG
ncbi:MAG: hypothetical protein AAF479_04125 [Pseudomonadota bacterium]